MLSHPSAIQAWTFLITNALRSPVRTLLCRDTFCLQRIVKEIAIGEEFGINLLNERSFRFGKL
jgi:hypothetical protein